MHGVANIAGAIAPFPVLVTTLAAKTTILLYVLQNSMLICRCSDGEGRGADPPNKVQRRVLAV